MTEETDILVAGASIFVPFDLDTQPFFKFTLDEDISASGRYLRLEADPEGVKLLRQLAKMVYRQHKLYADGDDVAVYPVPRRISRCSVCGKQIVMMAFKNTDVCSEGCRKAREDTND